MSRIIVGLCTLLLIVVFTPTLTRADPIVVTSGSIQITGIMGGPLGSLAGDNFLATGLGGGVGSFAPQHCFPCAPGESLTLGGQFLGTLGNGGGTAIINGTLFTNVGWTGQLVFDAGSIILPSAMSDLTIVAPFTFTGTLSGCSGICVVNPTIFTVQLVGSGIETLHLQFFTLPNGRPIFQFQDATLQFQEVPEPASIMLLGGGLALLTARLRRRRSSQNDSVSD
jgi:hypothetical protein